MEGGGPLGSQDFFYRGEVERVEDQPTERTETDLVLGPAGQHDQ